MEKKLKNKFLIIALILFCLSLVLMTLSFSKERSSIIEKKEIDAFLKIDNVTGLKVGNDSLDFGRIIYGSNAWKTIEVKNNYNFPVKLLLSSEGNISDFLVYDYEISLNSNESKGILISTIIFSNQTYGKYSGKLIILFEKIK